VLAGVVQITDVRAQGVFDRDWQVYVIPCSHTDVGFTAPVPQVLADHHRFLDSVVVYVDRTRNLPDGESFRWTVEIPWVLESYIEARSHAEVAALMDLVREGRVEIAGMQFGLQTDLTAPEELVRSLYYARALGRTYDIPVTSVLLNDTPGATWSLAQLLPRSGIPYLALGMNSALSNFYKTTSLPNLFYWEAQSGDRTLVWRSVDPDWAYLEGAITLGLYGTYSGMRTRMRAFLAKLEADGYPYEVVYVHAATGDNGPPRMEIVDNVRRWNEEHAGATLHIATVSDFFRATEALYAGSVPVFRGDAPNWWAWLFAPSSTEGASLSRRAQMRLPLAERFAAMARATDAGFDYPASALRGGYVNNLLFEDHNLGGTTPALNSEFWPRKMGWIRAANQTADEVAESSLQVLGGQIATSEQVLVVFNGMNWTRSETVLLAPGGDFPAGMSFGLLTDEGERVPVQRLSTGELVFHAQEVPPLGYRTFRVDETEDLVSPSVPLSGHVMLNDHYRVALDPATGSVVSLLDVRSSNEITRGDGRFNRYLYNSVNAPSGMSVVASDSGAVLQRMVFRGSAAGSNWYETEVILHAHQDRIDFLNRYDKRPPTAFEGVDFVFDFAGSASSLRYEIPFGHVRLFEDELSGFRTNHYGVQRWLNVASDSYQATLATRAAAVLAHNEPSFSGQIRMMASFDTGGTAYRAGKGQLSMDFAVNASPSSFSPQQSTRLAWAFNNPLEARLLPAGQSGVLPPDAFSFLDTGDSGLLMTAFKQAESGHGFVARLFNPGSETVEALVSSSLPIRGAAVLTPLEDFVETLVVNGLGVPVTMDPFEVKTLRLDLAHPTSVDDEAPAGRGLLLDQNYPNPFAGETMIRFILDSPASVRLVVTDLLGRRVAVLVGGAFPGGIHNAVWDGRDLAGAEVGSGIFFYTLQVESGTSTRRATRAMTRVRR
jgi:voltage-gated potassium channel Kch